MSKRNIVVIISCAVTFVALMALAAFYDLKLSIAIGDKNSLYGEFFGKFGEMPTYFGIPAAALILYQAVTKNNKFYKWLKPLYLVVTYAGFFLFFINLFDQFFVESKWNYLYIAVLSLITCAIAVIVTNGIDKNVITLLMYFATVFIFAVLIAQVTAIILDAIWSRQCFRNINAGNYPGGSTEGFTPWYKPTLGKHDPDALFTDGAGSDDSLAYTSFPNGVTLGACALFALVAVSEVFTRLKKFGILFYAVPAAFVFMTAIGSIVNRSAYLSDVVVAAAIGIGSVFLSRLIARKVLKKNAIITQVLYQEEENNV